MGSALNKRKRPQLLSQISSKTSTLTYSDFLFRRIYKQLRDAIKQLADDPEDANDACSTLKYFLREASWMMKNKTTPASRVEFLASIEEFLRGVAARVCEGGREGRDPDRTEEGKRLLEEAYAQLEGAREVYVACKSCSYVNSEAGVSCAQKAQAPSFQECMDKEQERRRTLLACGATPHLFDRGFLVVGPDMRKTHACLVEKGILPPGLEG